MQIAVTALIVIVAAFAMSTVSAHVDSHRRIDILVTEEGFVPKKIAVRKQEPVVLVFTRKTEKTCVKEVIIYVDSDHLEKKIERKLPLNQAVEIEATFLRSGEAGFTCAIGHRSGVVTVQ